MSTLHEDKGRSVLPLLPLRDLVIFPYTVTPLFVARPRSIQALEMAMDGEKQVFLATQTDPQLDEPGLEDLYSHGTIAQIVQLLKLPDGTVKVLMEGKQRGELVKLLCEDDCYLAEVTPFDEPLVEESADLEALLRSVCDLFDVYVNLGKKVPAEVAGSIAGLSDPGRLSDTVMAHLSLRIAEKQELLAEPDPCKRLDSLALLLSREVEILQIEKTIRSRVKGQMERSQKEYYLNEQMRAIQKELGEHDELNKEIQDLEETILKKRMSKEARDKALGELRKLKMMAPSSAEATVIRNYIDWLVELPWKKGTRDRRNIDRAEQIMDDDHYGLDKVKERILEYLAVQALVNKIKGPILCLVGPPGVGKTSLGRSIARSLGRKFTRISLGGMRDEAEIRGHRRTYIGAMPGKILQGLRKVGVRNPVMLLDEIDKVNNDFRGDPSSALLEVLDSEQNSTFADYYLEVDYDLSDVLFVATANSLHGISRPLLDRMEVIRLEGYTEDEKLHIAKSYLIPKQLEIHGFEACQVAFEDNAIYQLVRGYTRESGVRSLEREIANVARKLARRLVQSENRQQKFCVSANQLRELLGVARFDYGVREEKSCVGLATGLAWTEVGGELLNIEVAILPGQGTFTVTGKLGDVMQESSRAALTYVRSRWRELGLEKDFYRQMEIHIHVPEGAIPKDGPSAGITMAVALVSALTDRPVDRDIAMTGEITLRGRVLSIGGLKEKLLAAKRAGIRKVLIPEDNSRQLEEVPEVIRDALQVVSVGHMDQVVEEAFDLVVPLPAARAKAPTTPDSDALRH